MSYPCNLVERILVALTYVALLGSAEAHYGWDDTRARTSFGDFEFLIPAKWASVKPDRPKTVAMLLLNGTTWNNADGMIKVDVGKPAASSAKALAAVLAGNDGKVDGNLVSVDGSEGIKVETPSTDMSRPKYAVVIFRGQKAYLIMAAQKRGTDVSEAMDEVIKTWRWTKGG
jgi:hypothetical protein